MSSEKDFPFVQQIAEDLEIDGIHLHESEGQLLGAIAERVDKLLKANPDLLMSYLYRLDVLEGKINIVMKNLSPDPIHIGLAKLIWERQKERLALKKQFGQNDPIEGWDEW